MQAAYEATIKQLLEKLQAGKTKCFKLEQVCLCHFTGIMTVHGLRQSCMCLSDHLDLLNLVRLYFLLKCWWLLMSSSGTHVSSGTKGLCSVIPKNPQTYLTVKSGCRKISNCTGN